MASAFVVVRDSKNRAGPQVVVPIHSWTAFLAMVGQRDRRNVRTLSTRASGRQVANSART
jgi:hypothetical protein